MYSGWIIYGEHYDFLRGAWVLASGERVWA